MLPGLSWVTEIIQDLSTGCFQSPAAIPSMVESTEKEQTYLMGLSPLERHDLDHSALSPKVDGSISGSCPPLIYSEAIMSIDSAAGAYRFVIVVRFDRHEHRIAVFILIVVIGN